MVTGNGIGHGKTLIAVLGSWGILNFMMGEKKKGIARILLNICCGIGSIIALIDLYKILTDTYEVSEEKYFW